MFDDLAIAFFIGRLLKLRPRISKTGGKLVARSSVQAQLLSLFAAGRRVSVDPLQRVIRIRRRIFWFFAVPRLIHFDQMLNVTYDYREIAPGSSWAWAYQSSDLFTVSLLLKTGEEVLLFRFFGSAQFVNQGFLPDWMYWQEELEAKLMQGNQESESVAFAETVARIVGVPVRQPM